MKNNIKFLLAFLMVFSLSGCDKDFLEREPSEFISSEQLQTASEKNPAIAKAMVAGIYSLMIDTYSGLGPQEIFSHTDFGQKSNDIRMDMICGDMALTQNYYNKFHRIADLTGLSTTKFEAQMVWNYYFRVIKAANEVIDGLGGNESIPEDVENAANYGQARALRAHSYFNLANLFQHNYADHMSEPCMPIYDTQLEGLPKPLSSLAVVYDFIIEDLEVAVQALTGFNRTSTSQIDQSVAQGLLAYAYLMTGQNNQAATTAETVISNSGATVMNADEIIESGFRSVNIPGWLWSFDLTLDNTGSLLTFWGMVDVYTYSYAMAGDVKGMDENLYNMIPETDVRRNQFGPAYAADDYAPIYKFYDAGRNFGGDRNWTNDEVFMRVAEMYLIQAEALARSGQDAEAKIVLKALISDRDSAAEARVNALNNADLLEEIYLQWRIEMWGEGKSYYAMKRFKATFTRGGNHLNHVGVTFNHDDPRFIFEIPEDEVNNNPMLNEVPAVQNQAAIPPIDIMDTK